MNALVVCFLAGLGLLCTANALLRKGVSDAVGWSASAAVCVAGLLFQLGLPFLAFAELGLVIALLIVFRSQHRRGMKIEHKGDLRQRIAPVFVAALLGLAAPVVLGAEFSSWAPHAPIEGATAARGGTGLALELFGRKLLSLEMLALLALATALALRGPKKANRDNEGEA